jgi:DNA-binding GntR family transcriptional regulator
MTPDPTDPATGDRSFRRQPSDDPAYLQVKNAIISQMSSGQLMPGDRLPPERRLSTLLDTSRVTLRRALIALMEVGLVSSSPGIGWFVRSAAIGEPPSTLVSLTAMAAANGLVASSRVLANRVREATLDEAEQLRIAPGAELFELERVRYVDGKPIAVSRVLIPLELVPSIVSVDFATQSLYQLLEESFGVIPTRADYGVEARLPDPVVADLLEMSPTGPILEARQITFDQHGHPLELGWIAYRGDRYRFRATLERRALGHAVTRHMTGSNSTS